VAATLNADERSSFIVAALAGAELPDRSYDLGLCISQFESMRIRALINEEAHPDDQIPLHYGSAVDIREVERLTKERFGSE
jgi:hypothetical protein